MNQILEEIMEEIAERHYAVQFEITKESLSLDIFGRDPSNKVTHWTETYWKRLNEDIEDAKEGLYHQFVRLPLNGYRP